MGGLEEELTGDFTAASVICGRVNDEVNDEDSTGGGHDVHSNDKVFSAETVLSKSFMGTKITTH